MKPESLWIATAARNDFQPLDRDIEADVAVVGGGITGILCAHMLAGEGARVVVLEALRVGEGSSGNSTGNLYAMVGERYQRLAERSVAAVYRARASGVDTIEKIVQTSGIDCGFARHPWVMYSETDADAKELEHARRSAEAAGYVPNNAVELVPFAVRGAFAIGNQAQFNPAQFVKELARITNGERCRIFEHSRVTSIDPGAVCVLKTERCKVSARNVVLATHTPKGVLALQTALFPYREYGIAATLRQGALPRGIFWSAEAPYHSIRSHRASDDAYLVVVGGHHKTGQEPDTEACYRELAEFAASHFAVDTFRYRWSAQNYRSADGLPFIGRSALGDNIFVATGFAADGLTYAAVAAAIVTDAIGGRQNAHAPLFDAHRFTPVASAREFAKENLNVLAQYLKELRRHVDAKAFAEIGRGEGKSIEVGGEKLAAFRGDDGALHVVSAHCTHLRCLVAWNGAERTWDCPCHGSRFSCDGTVLEGPALADLPRRTIADG